MGSVKIGRLVYFCAFVGVSSGCNGGIDGDASDNGSARQAVETGSTVAATESVSVVVSLPVNVEPRRVAIGASGDVYLADRAHLEGSARTWMPVITNTGIQRTEIGANATCGSVVAFQNVFLRSSCIVNGDVTSKGAVTLQSGAYVAGDVLEHVSSLSGNAATDAIQFGWKASLPVPGTETIMIEPNQSRALAGGSYADIYVKTGATLELSSSRLYRFKSLMVSPGGIVRVASGQPTEIYVQDGVTFRGVVTTSTATTPPPITLVMMGSGQMSFESSIRALMIAPSGKVVLGGVDRDFYGAVFANSAELRSDVVLHHIGFELPQLTPGGGGEELIDSPVLPAPLVSATALCGARENLAFSGWPMPGFCPAQLGLSPFRATRTGGVRWHVGLSSPVIGQPVIGGNGNVHVATADGMLSTFSAQGNLRWKAALGAAASAPPTVLRSADIVVPLQTGELRTLSRTGAVRWVTTVCDSAVTAVSTDDDGGIVMGCASGKVTRRTTLGSFSWSATLDSPVRFVPTAGKPGVLLVVTDNGLTRLSLRDGSVVWSHALGAQPVGPAVLVRDIVYTATSDGKLHAYGTDGSFKWSSNLSGIPSGAPAINPWGQLLVPTTDGRLIPVGTVSGAVRPAIAVGSQSIDQVVVGSDGLAYVRSSDQQIRGLETQTGQVLWSHSLDAAPVGIALSEEGYVIASSVGGDLISLGTDPNRSGEIPTGGSGGTNAASCLAQMVETGATECTSGGTTDRIARAGGAGTTTSGQAACLVGQTLPSGVTSQGLGGFGYVADTSNGTGELVWWTPSGAVTDNCKLKFCQEVANGDGTTREVEVGFTHEQVAGSPPQGSSCQAMAGSVKCPIDPASDHGQACAKDAECPSGELCAVFCDDAACQTPHTACGKRLACQVGSLVAAPVGAFDEADPNTWPCEDLLECADTSAEFGVTGDTELRKTGALEQRTEPRGDLLAQPMALGPEAYESFADTLKADPCAAGTMGAAKNKQMDARSGNSGNKSWGLYIEPDVNQSYQVEPDEVFGLPQIKMQAGASFRAGAIVWGNDIEIVSAKADILLSTCGGHLTPSFLIFGEQIKEWEAFAGGDAAPAPEPPTSEETAECWGIRNSVTDKLAELRKALLDAKTAWNAYRANGNVVPQALCDRTRTVLGNVDPGGCTVASAQAWVTRYQNVANELETFVNETYRSVVAEIAKKTDGAVSLVPDIGGPFPGFGASTMFPIGPVTITLEIEIVGELIASGVLKYSMANADAGGSGFGPRVYIEAAPGASADAVVYCGAGIPGVSVGIEGDIRLLGVTAPIQTGIALGQKSYRDPRNYDSSGIFGYVAGGPAAMSSSAMQQWQAEWTHGAAVKLETMSGKLSLAARVRLLFFSKTFRKKIADWKGLTKEYQFVGNLGNPTAGKAGSDMMHGNVPFPKGSGNLTAALDATETTPIADGFSLSRLGGTNTPGACSCAAPQAACAVDSDCCNSSEMECRLPVSGGSTKQCLKRPPPPAVIM